MNKKMSSEILWERKSEDEKRKNLRDSKNRFACCEMELLGYRHATDGLWDFCCNIWQLPWPGENRWNWNAEHMVRSAILLSCQQNKVPNASAHVNTNRRICPAILFKTLNRFPFVCTVLPNIIPNTKDYCLMSNSNIFMLIFSRNQQVKFSHIRS